MAAKMHAPTCACIELNSKNIEGAVRYVRRWRMGSSSIISLRRRSETRSSRSLLEISSVLARFPCFPWCTRMFRLRCATEASFRFIFPGIIGPELLSFRCPTSSPVALRTRSAAGILANAIDNDDASTYVCVSRRSALADRESRFSDFLSSPRPVGESLAIDPCRWP